MCKPLLHRWLFLMGYGCAWLLVAQIACILVDSQPPVGFPSDMSGLGWAISLIMAFVLMVIYGIAGFIVMLIHGIRARKAPPKTE